MSERRISRRIFLELSVAAGAAVALTGRPGNATAKPDAATTKMNTRPIPSTGEALPVIGLGTARTFDVGSNAQERAPLAEVLQRCFAAGARVIDSSPMYGEAETVAGDLVAQLHPKQPPFWATKVWTSGRSDGIEQMERSFRRLRTKRIDLMQVHNLVDWKTHLAVLREWKKAGRIRYIGITHYALGELDELERLVRSEHLDFVQLPYSMATRDAEKRLLPAARDTGTAVLVMRPFEEGELFRRVKGKSLPAWAAEIDCTSWAQFFLKWLLGNPSVTCPIPATADPAHAADNLQAGFGRIPDEPMRRRMLEIVGT